MCVDALFTLIPIFTRKLNKHIDTNTPPHASTYILLRQTEVDRGTESKPTEPGDEQKNTGQQEKKQKTKEETTKTNRKT